MIKQLKLLLAGFLLIGTFSAAGATASAAFDVLGQPCASRPDATVCKDNDTSQTTTRNRLYGQDGLVGKIVRILAIIVGFAAVIVLIIAGIQYMNSGGDSTKVNNAKNAMLYAVIGIVVAVIAPVLILFVIGRIIT